MTTRLLKRLSSDRTILSIFCIYIWNILSILYIFVEEIEEMF